MSFAGRRGGTRALPRTLFDGLVFVALLVLVLYGAKRSGVIDLEAGVYRAADGDSLRRGETSVRLHGIDAPELAQECRDGQGRDYPCGREAMEALAGLIRGKDVSCTAIDTDRYDRAVSLCRAGGVDLNGEMVRLGWATAYRQHSLAYVAQESAARKSRRGLWQGTFEPPGTWRDRHPR